LEINKEILTIYRTKQEIYFSQSKERRFPSEENSLQGRAHASSPRLSMLLELGQVIPY